MTPTRIELLTAPAAGGVAVLRLSGAECRRMLELTCRPRGSGQSPRLETGRLTVCRLCDGDEVLDEAVVAVVDEHGGGMTAEICLHGGVRVVQRAVMLFTRLGATRPADDASARLADEPRLQIAARPDAATIERAIDALWPRAITRRYAAWLLMQRRLLAEAAFAHAVRDSDAVKRGEFERRSMAAQRLVRGLRIAIVGPPNAGKSTLANALAGRERSVTSDQPGTTRDWVETEAVLDGWPVTLTDTAGARATDDALESLAIERGFERSRSADLILVVFDVRAARDNAEDCAEFIHRSQNAFVAAAAAQDPRGAALDVRGAAPPPPCLLVLNKADLLAGAAERESAAAATELRDIPAPAILISAQTGHGLAHLERAVCAALGLDQLELGPAAMTPALAELLGLRNDVAVHP